MARIPDIRLARPAEEEAVMALLRLRHQEDDRPPFDETKVRACLRQLIRRVAGVVLVVAGREIEGTMGLILAAPWDSSAIHLENLWHFIGPAYRKSDNAKRLIMHAKDYASGLQIPLYIEAIENAQTAPKAALIGRQLPRAGSLFIHRPGTAAPP